MTVLNPNLRSKSYTAPRIPPWHSPPQLLTRYVFRHTNGSYRYKRNVQVGLRKLLGKDTIYRQLENSYKEAMVNLPLVHERIEALLDEEGEKSTKQRSFEIIRCAMGD